MLNMKIFSFVHRTGAFKLAKQESLILQAIRELGSGTVEEIGAYAYENLGLKTKQTPERIAAYYMVSLKKLGLVESSGSSDSGRRVTVVIESDEEEAA
jgi:hypothetical protein